MRSILGRAVPAAAALLASGVLSVSMAPRAAAAAADDEKALTREEVREIVREELERHFERIEKMISERSGRGFLFTPETLPGFRSGPPDPLPPRTDLFRELLPMPQASGGWLGVMLTDGDDGVLIEDVVDDSPAETAGLMAGDVIRKVGGDEVESVSDVVEAISSKKPGARVTLEISRDGAEMRIAARLGSRTPEGIVEAPPAADARERAPERETRAARSRRAEPAPEPARRAREAENAPAPSEGEGPGFLGVEFAPGPEGRGVAVTGVVPRSPAEKAGLAAGDVLLSINGNDVGAENLAEVIGGSGAGSRIKVKYRRGDDENTIVLRLAPRGMDGSLAAEESTVEEVEPPAALRVPAEKAEKAEKAAKAESAAKTEKADKAEPKPGFLGVETRAVESDAREVLGLQAGQGVLVQRVVEGSAAEKAGLERNDLILSVGGTSVGTPEELGEVVRGLGAGKKTEVAIVRKGERRSVSVTLGGRD